MTAKRDSTKVMWRVQVRKSRTAVWKNKGLFETRRSARESATDWRVNWWYWGNIPEGGVGFGNTRVVRFEKKGRK